MVVVLWQLWFCLVNLPELLHIDHLYQVCSLLSYVFMCFGLGRVGGRHWDGTRGTLVVREFLTLKSVSFLDFITRVSDMISNLL